MDSSFTFRKKRTALYLRDYTVVRYRSEKAILALGGEHLVLVDLQRSDESKDGTLPMSRGGEIGGVSAEAGLKNQASGSERSAAQTFSS